MRIDYFVDLEIHASKKFTWGAGNTYRDTSWRQLIRTKRK